MRINQFAAATLGAMLLAGTAMAQTAATATTDLNIRSGPGPQFDVIGVIPGGASATLGGCLEAGNWCQVTHEGTQGWVFGDYLTATIEGQPDPMVVTQQRTQINVPVVTYDEGNMAEGATVGAATGAVAGAVLGGPVGAAIGLAAGTALGTVTNVPEPVISYVQQNRTETVYLDGEVVVGAELPETVEVTPVPDSEFGYVYVNGVPAVVEPQTRQVVHIVR